jgi:predicted anti-sigma-YlaC factor YlaD
MICRKAQRLFDVRLDNQLDTATQAAFDAHIAACPACHSEWQAYSSAWQLVGRLQPIEPSHGFVERTMRRLDENPVPSHGLDWLPIFRWAALGLTVLAMSLGGWLGWQQWTTLQTAKNTVKPIDSTPFLQVSHGSFFEDMDVIASLEELTPSSHKDSQP